MARSGSRARGGPRVRVWVQLRFWLLQLELNLIHARLAQTALGGNQSEF